MINIIYGLKGSGKTERIISQANDCAKKSKGVVVYVTDRKEHSIAVDNSIRFVDVNEYGIKCEKCCVPFIKGLLAGNYDITDVYIDGLAKFIGMKIEDMENIYTQLEMLSTEHKVNFTLTVSIEKVPDFMKKYL